METKEYSKIIQEKEGFPVQYDFQNQLSSSEILHWYQENEAEIQESIYDKGAILMKNTNISTIDDFHVFTEGAFPKFRNYIDGNYPRKQLKDHVYISTEYDPKFDITMHNELSYSENWPSKLVLGCCIPPEEGGETPLIDSREICRTISKELLEELERKEIKYIRNLHGGSGMGPSWQETFETEEKAKTEKICHSLNIQFEWKANNGLRLVSKRPATRRHPVTGEKVWFNQVDQYHPSHFPEEVYETLMMVYEGDESELPLNVSFGDNSPISIDIIKEITGVMNQLMIVRKWDKSDIVVIDNMLVGHGRKSYKGNRKIIVSMSV